MKQNITLNLDREIIRKARVIAAKRQTSISRMLSCELERIVQEADRYEGARKRALTFLREGLHLGGNIPACREELHGR